MARSEREREQDMENTVKYAVGRDELIRLAMKHGSEQVLWAISSTASFHMVPDGEGIGSSDMYYIRRSLYRELGEDMPEGPVDRS